MSDEGAVYIAQPQESRIRVFDDDGTFVRYIGRAGDGPGEFRSLGWICLRSDTLWASDGEATVLGHVDLSALASYRHDGLLRAAPVPFGVYGLVGWDPNGRFAILARQGAPATREAAFTLTMVTPGADTVWSRTVRVSADAVPSAVRDSVQAARRRAFSLGGISADHARAIETAAPVPDRYPPVHSIRVGSDGRIWLGVGAPDSGRWQVLNPDGTAVAHATVPPRATILAATSTHAWGVYRDDLDVPSVVRWRLLPD